MPSMATTPHQRRVPTIDEVRRQRAAIAEASEPLPDPREALEQALRLDPHLDEGQIENVLHHIHAAGLTVCWRVP